MGHHSYVILRVSAAVYEEIQEKLEAGHYSYDVHDDRLGPVIDMHGIALQAEED